MDTISAPGASSPAAPPQAASQARRRPLRIMAVLASLMALNSISTDMYLPAMPQMAHDMGAGAGELEYIISGYLVGFSLGQLLWGAVSDRFGRRLPIALGLVLFDVGSAGCALSGTAAEVIGWRVVQAVGACAGIVLARAMVRDLFERDRAAQMLSTLITIMAVAPLIGPLVGGQVLTFASWPWTFWLMVAAGGGLLAALFTVPETLRRSAATCTPCVTRSAATATCCATGASSPSRGSAAFSTSASTPTWPARLSPTSATTTSRRATTACCSDP